MKDEFNPTHTATPYIAFGNKLEERDEIEPFGAILDPAAPTNVDHVRFMGKMQDPVTGFFYFRHRWYDAQARRFVSPDPTPFDEFNPTHTANPYIAFANNPVQNTDPSGQAVVGFRGFGNDPTFFDKIVKRISVFAGPKQIYEPGTTGNINSAKNFILNELATNPSKPVVIVGYSAGGEDAISLAGILAPTKVDVLLTVDLKAPTRLLGLSTTTIPFNVKQNLNFYERIGDVRFQGDPNTRQQHSTTKIENKDVSDFLDDDPFLRPFAHLEIIKKSLLQNLFVTRTKKILKDAGF